MTSEAQKKAVTKYKKSNVKRLYFEFYKVDHDLFYKFMKIKGKKAKNTVLRELLKGVDENDFELIQED